MESKPYVCVSCGAQYDVMPAFCAKCGEAFQDQAAPAYYPRPGYDRQYPSYNGLSIASFVCSLTGMVFCVTSIVGLVLGIVALVLMKKDPYKRGKGFAIAGVIIGAILTFAMIAYIGFMVIYISTVSN